MNRTLLLLVAAVLTGCENVAAPASPAGEPQLGPQLSIIAEVPVTDLGDLGGNYSIPQTLNELGQVIGVAHTLAGRRAFLSQNGSMIDLGSLGGRSSHPTAINNSGQIVGGSATSADLSIHAFLWQNGKMIDLFPAAMGVVDGQAAGINDAGQIVGYGTSVGRTQSYLWQNGTITALGSLGGARTFARAINHTGQVAGTGETATGAQHAFLWQNGVLTDLGTLGGANSFAVAINNPGQVVGASETATGAYHAFIWQNGTMTDLGTLGGGYSRAMAINKPGQVVGESEVSGGAVHAFLWQNGRMIDLGATAEEGSEALAINEVGQIAGYVWASDGQPERGVVWQNGTRVELPPQRGWNGSLAVAINRRGQAVGYSSMDGTSSFRATLWTVSRPAPPAEEVADLISQLNEMLASGTLSQHQAQDLLAKLDVAAKQLERENIQAAINQLLAFIRMVQADVSAGRLSADDGQRLIEGAQRAIDQLGP